MVFKNRRLVCLVVAHLSVLGLLPAYSSTNANLDPNPTLLADRQRQEDLDQLLRPGNDSNPWRVALGEKRATFDLLRDYHSQSPIVDHQPYAELINQAAERHDLDRLLLAALIEAESGFDSQVVSARGAVGLMQLLPSTVGKTPEELRDPATNIDLGSAYFRQLLENFGGDLELALAAYNAGPNQVRRHAGVPPFEETRTFVDRVMTTYLDHHRAAWEKKQQSR